MSYIDARLGTFEEPSRRQLLGIMLVQLSEAPAAELFGAAMTRGMEARLQRMASFPGASVELAEAEERVLDDGVQLWSRGAMVTMPDREPDSMTMYVARQGPFVAHVTTTGAEMTPEVVAAAARALFAALPDE
jgi:hypothetical protein